MFLCSLLSISLLLLQFPPFLLCLLIFFSHHLYLLALFVNTPFLFTLLPGRAPFVLFLCSRCISPFPCQTRGPVEVGVSDSCWSACRVEIFPWPPDSCLLRRLVGVSRSWRAIQRRVFDVVVSLTSGRAASLVEATFTRHTVPGSPLCTCHCITLGSNSDAEQRTLQRQIRPIGGVTGTCFVLSLLFEELLLAPPGFWLLSVCREENISVRSNTDKKQHSPRSELSVDFDFLKFF